MGTGSIDTVASGKINATYINKILSALIGSFVGRNSSGAAASGQDLGTETYPWGDGWVTDLTVSNTIKKGDYQASHPIGSIATRTWTQATTNLSANNAFASHFSEDLKIWVIGGALGYFSYSYNGIDWTAGTTLPTGAYIRSITYCEDISVFVLTGSNSAVSTEYGYYSSDGINWTLIADANYAGSRGCCSSENDGKILAVGIDGTASITSDGINWTAVTTGLGGAGYDLYCCTYAENKTLYVAGSGDASGTQIGYSTDGTTWSVASPTAVFTGSYIASLAYSETLERFVGCDDNGDLCYSSNGISWTQSNVTGGGAALYVVYSEYMNVFIAAGDAAATNYVKVSTDGIYWADFVDTGFSSSQINGVSVSEYLGLFLIAGDGGKAAYSL